MFETLSLFAIAALSRSPAYSIAIFVYAALFYLCPSRLMWALRVRRRWPKWNAWIMWSDACVLIPVDVNMQYMRIKIMERQESNGIRAHKRSPFWPFPFFIFTFFFLLPTAWCFFSLFACFIFGWFNCNTPTSEAMNFHIVFLLLFFRVWVSRLVELFSFFLLRYLQMRHTKKYECFDVHIWTNRKR